MALAIALSLCAGRLLQLQGFDSSAYAAMSSEQLTRTLPLLPSRGDITDRNGLVLATTEAAVAVTADPVLTRAKAAEISAVLAAHLGTDQSALYALLTKPKTRFVYLAKKVPALTYSRIAADLTSKRLYGVFREADPIRTYPGRSVGATVIGYVNGDGKGMAGLERSMNAELAGVEGKEVYESAPNGSRIPLGTSRVTPAVNGVNYQLTLDSELQWVAERRLAAQVQERRADSGFAITLDVKTGEVLALANVPTYDSARPGAAKHQNLINRAVSNPYEPGSVQKVLTAAALLDSKTTTVETRVQVPPRLASGGHSIKDAFSHGTLTWLMRGVIAKSSNIGTILMARQMPAEQLRDYLTAFGLGGRTGIELPGESSGILPPSNMPGYTRDQIAFGQAVSVTGVQQAAAIAGIINGGQYQPPTVIKGATDSTGSAVSVPRRAPRQIVSPQTSAGVRNLMRAVVDNSKPAPKGVGLENYQTGGKTGTAQRSEQSCRCYQGYVTSYVGFAPLTDPKILTYVVLNNPRRGQQSGTSSAAPVYRDIMNFALPRYHVPPTTKKLKPQPIAYGKKR
ncbi:MAG TPA: penicillin-binding protein 2 [Propionibacteriaceae bacterium]|nr:penicillin-binding protein 2 [Propionibacteriaceae bacterium]